MDLPFPSSLLPEVPGRCFGFELGQPRLLFGLLLFRVVKKQASKLLKSTIKYQKQPRNLHDTQHTICTQKSTIFKNRYTFN